jgi:O-antigen ligase
VATSVRDEPANRLEAPESSGGHRQRLASTCAGWLLFALALWLVAAGRWGSYVGLPGDQVYVTEIVLAVVVLLSLAGARTRPAAGEVRRHAALLAAPLALAVWGAVRLTPGVFDHGSDALRDYAPYAYAVVAVLVLANVRPSHVRYAVLAAAIFHAAWVTPLLRDSAAFVNAHPLGKTHVFELRTDFDAVAAGVLALACLLVATTRPSLVERLLFAAVGVWSGVLVVLINNRAGLLATALAGSWTALHLFHRYSSRSGMSQRRRRQVAGSLVLAVAVLAGLVLAVTPAGHRLTDTFDSNGQAMENKTASARLTVYGKVLDYVAESPGRVVVGVGMGPDFLTAADATRDYDPGETLGVRSPHDFLIGTYARLGLVGLLLQLVLVASGYLLAWRTARSANVPALDQLAALLVVALPVAAAVGVVLESPFGAVPYLWGFGVLVASVGARRRDAAA